jgi:hypothetical protein
VVTIRLSAAQPKVVTPGFTEGWQCVRGIAIGDGDCLPAFAQTERERFEWIADMVFGSGGDLIATRHRMPERLPLSGLAQPCDERYDPHRRGFGKCRD